MVVHHDGTLMPSTTGRHGGGNAETDTSRRGSADSRAHWYSIGRMVPGPTSVRSDPGQRPRPLPVVLRIPPVHTTLDSWISGGARRAISGSSHELFVRQDGPIDGKPVTLLHGFPASSFDWAGVMPNLTGTGYRVTTLDFLGYGNSDKPYPYRYSLIEQASLVQALWRDLGIDRTALVAHDYGVSVAQELLSRDPGCIESMAWLNGGMFPDLHRPADFQRRLAELSGDAAEDYVTETLYRKALLGVFGRPVPDHTLGEMWTDFSKSGGARVAPALLGYMAERREHAARWSHAVESYSGPQT